MKQEFCNDTWSLFQQTRVIGDAAEKVLADYFNSKGMVTAMNKTNTCDIHMIYTASTSLEVKYTSLEVKCDHQGRYTNNIFLEFEQLSLPSGIEVTTAEYYTFFIPSANTKEHVIYMISSKMLKHLIKEKVYKFIGNGHKSKGYIFPISTIKEYCKRIITMEITETNNIPNEIN